MHAPAKIPAISSRKIQKNTTCYHAGNERYGAQEGWLCEELWVPNLYAMGSVRTRPNTAGRLVIILGQRKVINKRRESGPKARASKERSHYTKIDNLEASPRIYAFSEGGSLVALAVPLQLASAARLQQAFPRAKNERP